MPDAAELERRGAVVGEVFINADMVAMMAKRGIAVSHTTIMRWVLRYVPEFEKRWARYARPVHPSWRVDETAVSVRAGRIICIARSTSTSL